MRKVMIFGVFDGVHDGHRALFEQAKKEGDYLVAVVAQDQSAERLKRRLPRKPLDERIDDLSKEPLVDEVALGDAEPGAYEIVMKHRPAVIALGYDQGELKKDIEENRKRFTWQPKLVVTGPHKPEKYHSSLLVDR